MENKALLCEGNSSMGVPLREENSIIGKALRNDNKNYYVKRKF